MNRRAWILLALLVPCLAGASWYWLRPYQSGADPAARMTIRFASLERDHSFFWLGLVLEARDGSRHDLEKPLRLVLADGRELEAADTTLQGSPDQPIEALALRFWIEEGDLDGPLRLRLNDGELSVRRGSGAPPTPTGKPRYFHHDDW